MVLEHGLDLQAATAVVVVVVMALGLIPVEQQLSQVSLKQWDLQDLILIMETLVEVVTEVPVPEVLKEDLEEVEVVLDMYLQYLELLQTMLQAVLLFPGQHHLTTWQGRVPQVQVTAVQEII